MDKQAKGYMLYPDDWAGFEDYTDEEIGAIFKALLIYFSSGEYTAFEDRGMKLFYKNGIRAIELGRDNYNKRCIRNAYNRYKGTCKQNNTEPLEYEDWLTTVYDRQRPSTMVTNTNANTNANANDNANDNANTEHGQKTQQEIEDDFEKKRDAQLKMLNERMTLRS